MKKTLANLIGKKFSVYVGGEFERLTDFLGFINLLSDYADFFEERHEVQRNYLSKALEEKYAYIDANIFVKIGK